MVPREELPSYLFPSLEPPLKRAQQLQVTACNPSRGGRRATIKIRAVILPNLVDPATVDCCMSKSLQEVNAWWEKNEEVGGPSLRFQNVE